MQGWRFGFDFDFNGKLSFHEFCNACRLLGIAGNIRKIWSDLDTEDTGTVTLHDIEPAAAEAIDAFYAWAKKRDGNIRQPHFESKAGLRSDHYYNTSL